MMKDSKLDYIGYRDNAVQLAKQLFSEEVFNKMNSTKYKGFKWEGIDITTHHITATCLDIKERFSSEQISRFKKEGTTALELFIQAVFHYGYQQCVDVELTNYKRLNEINRLQVGILTHDKEVLEKRVNELEEKLKSK